MRRIIERVVTVVTTTTWTITWQADPLQPEPQSVPVDESLSQLQLPRNTQQFGPPHIAQSTKEDSSSDSKQ